MGSPSSHAHEVVLFSSHPLTPDIDAALNSLPPSIAAQVRVTFRDYEALLHTAEVDRQAVLGFVDTLGCRLDDIPNDGEAARRVAIHVTTRALEDAMMTGRRQE